MKTLLDYAYGDLIRARRDLGADDVELGADGAPVAFRIWSSGANPTDKGTHFFTEQSARLLLEEQSIRGNLYSIDFDHASLTTDAPPEARRAAGWHRLEVRNGDLWAVDVQWTDVARVGLTKDPPEFRYFSPAYSVDAKSDEIVAYLNTALTNNPATWNVTALATRAGSQQEKSTMNEEEMRAALKAWAGDDEEKQKKAAAALKAAFPPSDDGDGDKDKGEDEKKATDADGDDDGDKKSTKATEGDDGGDDKGDQKDSKVAASRVLTATLDTTTTLDAKLLARVEELERQADERKKTDTARERTEIFASRPDISADTKKLLENEEPAKIKQLFATIPKKGHPNQVVDPTLTRGAGHRGVGEFQMATRYSDRAEELDRKMLGVETAPKVRMEGTSLVITTMTPSQARAHMKTIEARQAAASKAEVK